MKIGRRGFLGFLATIPLLNKLAPQTEVPARSIRVPLILKPSARFGEHDVVVAELNRVQEHIPLLFERDDAFYATLNKGSGDYHGTRRQKGRVNSRRGRRG